MTGLSSRLESVPDAGRFPARHDVREAVLELGGARVPVVVKRSRRRFARRLGKTLGEQAAETARHLLAHGIDTPEPLGVEVTAGESVLVVRKVEGAVQVRDFFLRHDDPSREEPAVRATFEEVVSALGRIARRLHDAGVFYRDLTDGNVLVTEGERGPRLWLVDLDRARVRSGPLGTFDRLRDLSRPGLNDPAARRLLLGAYYAPGPVPALVPPILGLMRARVLLWDRLKRRARPWKR